VPKSLRLITSINDKLATSVDIGEEEEQEGGNNKRTDFPEHI